MVTPGLGLVIPALNEAATIEKVVTQASAYGMVIVVDDGSNDATAELAGRCGAVVVTHAERRGYDGALNSGFVRAKELGLRYVVTLDADGQLPAALVPAFVRQLETGADIVVGIRDTVPRVVEQVFREMTRALYGIRDPFCGMKGYRMKLFDQLGWFDSYGSVGTELMLHAARHGAKLAQLSVPTKPRIGKARIGGSLKASYVLGRAALIGLAKHFER